MKIVKFMHHNVKVSAMDHLRGRHRDHCLCFQCKKLNIEDREKNCKIANLLFSVCKMCEITTPVFYCKEFIAKGMDKQHIIDILK